ncbi:hypothetical protein Q31b_46910 [Novipirellula aureliae]|uniref:Secreted protein n=1 Tax=Novipirellula aureliae TaxID=2527966 RepID=A0A5C6DMM2_9BACT|nr:hypothetical protein [Novipirellula aureliae]TWU37902.1 hypothetical protein Q31b_46910 [Novipirellula aureliae]
MSMSIRISVVLLSLCTLTALVGCGKPGPSIVTESATDSEIAEYKAMQKQAQEDTDSEL